MSEHSTNGPTTNNAPSITSSVKEKNLRRAAAGKRLGAISRKAKETKRLEREAQAQQSEQSDNTDNKYTLYFVGGLVVVETPSYLYLNKDQLRELTNRRNVHPQGGNEPKTPPARKKSSRIFLMNKNGDTV